MAVVDSEKPAGEGGSSNGGPPRSSTTTQQAKQKKGLGAWVKKNKVAAGALAIGGAVLLMSHKGGKGEGNGKAIQEANEARQAAAIAGGIPASSVPGGSEGGASGGTTPGSSTPTPADPSGTVAPTDPALAEAIGALGGNVAALAAAEERGNEPLAGGGDAKAKPAQKAAKKKKPAKKKAAKAKPKHSGQHGGVTVHGRHFPGGKSVHKGPVHKDSHGNTKQTVTVNHGGKSTTHTSHNNGQHWTDNTPGHSPPSRGPATHTHPAHKPAAVHHAPQHRVPAAGRGPARVVKPKPATKAKAARRR